MPRRPSHRPVPRQVAPDAIRLEYYKAARAIPDRMIAVVKRDLLPNLEHILAPVDYHDDSADADPRARDLKQAQTRAKKILDGMAGELADAVRPRELEKIAAKFGGRTSQYQKDQLARQIRAAASVDINKIAKTEKGIKGEIDGWIAVNVDLISSLPSRYFDDVKSQVYEAIDRGTRHEVLADNLAARYEIPINQAKLIARDQIGKLYGVLNAERQQNLGITKFIWRSVRDNRVRPDHEDFDGQEYSYDDPPESLPGEPINCRCYADPVLDEIFNSVDTPNESD